MKRSLRSCLVCCAFALFSVDGLAVEADVAGKIGGQSKVPAGVPLRRIESSAPAQAAPPTYEMRAAWNSQTQINTVTLANEGDKPLRVVGVQSTSGIFLVDFPQRIRPRQSDSVSFVYSASANTDGDTELIRVLTDQDVREIVIKVQREVAAKLDVRELAWQIGEPALAKSAMLTVTPGTVTPVAVRTTGGNLAALEKLSDTTWRINVTPRSTLKAEKFAVFVSFDKPLLGQAIVVLGVVSSKD